jgi:hypothetical protein
MDGYILQLVIAYWADVLILGVIAIALVGLSS